MNKRILAITGGSQLSSPRPERSKTFLIWSFNRFQEHGERDPLVNHRALALLRWCPQSQPNAFVDPKQG